MKPSHAIALALIPFALFGTTLLATWSRRFRDAAFFLMIILAVFAERMDVNFFSEAWYRGTTRGIQVSLVEILAFGVLVGCRLARLDPSRRWRPPASLGLMLLYLFYGCISVIVSEPKIFGAFELSKIAGSILVFLAAAEYAQTRREWTILIAALACVVGFEGAWAIRQRLFSGIERVAGTLDHANSLSMYFCMTVPPLIACAYAGWSRLMRWACAGASVLAAAGLILTVSRAGIPIFAIVVLGTFLACASWKITVSRAIVRTLIAAGVVAMVAASWSQVMQRYGQVSLEEEYLDPHVDGRGIYLRLARSISEDHFFGVGLNNWSYYVSKTYGPRLGFDFMDYDYLKNVYGTSDDDVYANSYLAAPAHNLAALTLGELGIPGLILFILLWLRWLGMGAAFVFDSRGDPRRTLGVGLFFATVGLFGQSITEWVYRQTPILMTFCILIGALASITASKKRERKLARQESLNAVEPPAEPFLAQAL